MSKVFDCILHELLLENLQLIVLTTICCKYCKANSQPGNKEQKLITETLQVTLMITLSTQVAAI